MPEARPYIPALARLYRPLEPLAWLLVRLAAGAMLIPHGAQKLFGLWGGDMAKTIAGFAKLGLEPASVFAWYIGSLEFFGGILLVLGLFTRPVAVLVAGFMAVAVVHVHWGNGFFWTKAGFEYPLMWMILALALAIRGAGPHSLDSRIGREV
jgi:putative oxidoreductase